MLPKILTLFAVMTACQAVFPYHHLHHHHPATSHQQIHKHDGPHHPVHVPIHHPIPIHHHIPIHPIPIHHEPIHHLPLLHHHIPPPIHHEPHHVIDHHSFPEYKFEYSVHDHHTGDFKSQHESRHGDHVVGAYELVEPDGRHRKVEYKADDHTGFNAIVHHSSPHHHLHIAHHHI